MYLKFRNPFATAAAAAIVLAGTAISAAAESVDFEGERITITVPFREGGASDTYTRLIAPYLSEHLPGQPSMVVRNIPGGSGGLVGANRFERTATTDGLEVFAGSVSTNFNYALDAEGVEFDLSRYEPVILSPQGAAIYVSSDLGVEGAAGIPDLVGQDLVYAGQSPTSAELRQLFIFNMLGLDVQTIWGVSTSERRMAFMRGEVNIGNESLAAFLTHAQPMVDDGLAVPLFSYGVLNDAGEFERDPHFPDLPHFLEVYEQVNGAPMTGVELEVWTALYHLSVSASKYLLLPPETPQDIVDAYSAAATEMLADAEMRGETEELLGQYPQYVGENAKRILEGATTLSPEARAWIVDFLETEYDISI